MTSVAGTPLACAICEDARFAQPFGHRFVLVEDRRDVDRRQHHCITAAKAPVNTVPQIHQVLLARRG